MGPSAGNQAETPNFSTLPGCPHIVIITRNFRQVSPENRQTFAFQVPLSRQSCRYPCHKNCRRGIPRQLRFNLLLSCPPRLLFSSGKKRWRHRKAKVCRHLWVYNLEQSKVGPGGVRKGYGAWPLGVGWSWNEGSPLNSLEIVGVFWKVIVTLLWRAPAFPLRFLLSN